MSAKPAQPAQPAEPVAHLDRGRWTSRLALTINCAILPLSLLLLWQAIVVQGVVKAELLPAPTQVVATWLDLIVGQRGEGRYAGVWWMHASASAGRVFAGFALASVVGVLLGVLIGLSRAFERLVDPTIQLLRNIPITAWVPLSILFFGIADRPAVFLIALGAVFPTIVNTTYGVKQVNALLVKAALMMGASRSQLVRLVVIPAALPAIFTGLRLSMGIAWVLVVVSEMIAVKSGLGYLLFESYQFFRPDVMIAAMLSIGLLGFLSDRLVLLLHDRLLAWNRLETLRG
jgi:NitT/TauT family transport system permease protein